MKKQFETILLERRLVFVPSDKTEEDEKKRAYLNSFLLVNFGVELENPERVCDDVIRSLDDLLSLKVPESFYESPQDTAYFNKGELLLEQVVSYFLGYGTNLKRVELFKKVLPRKYVVGGEIKTRKYRIIDEKEADNSLKEVASNLASYKRPFSPAETVRFLSLMKEGYFPVDGEIACRDNIFPLLEDFPDLASRLDKKDLVKLSIEYFGDGDKLVFFPDDEDDARHLAILRGASTKVRDCPLSKRQAKYFNKILKITSGKKGKETNEASPYKKLNKMMKEKGAVSAAEYLSTQGSLLERNLRYLLSRCVNAKQVREVIDKLDDKNPTLLFQIYSSFTKDRKGQRRTFVYVKDKKIRTHVETQEEVEKRRSFPLLAKSTSLTNSSASLSQPPLWQLAKGSMYCPAAAAFLFPRVTSACSFIGKTCAISTQASP